MRGEPWPFVLGWRLLGLWLGVEQLMPNSPILAEQALPTLAQALSLGSVAAWQNARAGIAIGGNAVGDVWSHFSMIHPTILAQPEKTADII